jgi:hypothetical protein
LRNPAGAPQAEKPKRSSKRYIVIILIAIFVVLAFPTPHSRLKQESYVEYETVTKTDLEETLPCSGTLQDCRYWEWGLTDLPTTLKIVVSLTSTEAVEVKVRSVSRTESDRTSNTHYYTFYANGPSLYVTVTNPGLLCLGNSAVVSGDIKVYYEYQTQVPVTKYRTVPVTDWLPWWMP